MLPEKKLTEFTKESINEYLRMVAREYRKMGGKRMPAELVLVGGAAVIANYGFRNMTTDIDAVIHASSAMKEVINRVGDQFHLPNNWLNEDFARTASYSAKLVQYSKYYQSYYGVMNVRTVTAEYLIAMKLCSGRIYKNDRSDIIGILREHQENGQPITIEKVDKAVENLYGGWERIPEESKKFISDVITKDGVSWNYETVRKEEQKNKDVLINFEQSYSGIVNDNNVSKIIRNLREQEELEEDDELDM